jgi:hypothetical protein
MLKEVLSSPGSASRSNVPDLEESRSSLDGVFDGLSCRSLEIMNQQPHGDRLSIEIKDPLGRCVELEQQLEAVQRAVVGPLKREIARIKNATSLDAPASSSEIQELEIIIMPTLSIISDDNKDSDEVIPSLHQGDNEDEVILPDPLVDQSLRRQTEHELLAMAESLEMKQEWRSFYAYHLERFRQLHIAVVKQYHDKLLEVDARCHKTEESLRIAQRDLVHSRRAMADCSKGVVQVEKEKSNLRKELETCKQESAKRLLKLGKEHKLTKSNLEGELKVALEEIDEMEKQVKKLEVVKKENRSSKRLNAVLNDKLRAKTKEATDLFAENLKLREQAMLLRRDLNNSSQKNKTLADSLKVMQEEHCTLYEEMVTLRDRINHDNEVALENELLKLKVSDSDLLLESQREELQETRDDRERLRDEISRLCAINQFEREVNESLCETLEGALQEAIACNDLQHDELWNARLSKESIDIKLAGLASEFSLEKECFAEQVESLQGQLDEAAMVKVTQERDLEECQRTILALADEVAALKNELESERNQGFDINENLTSHVLELFAMNENQMEQSLMIESQNGTLEEESAELKAKIESLQEASIKLTMELESRHSQAEDMKILQGMNAFLAEQVSSLQSELETEREHASEEIETLKVDVGGLQMDNALLEYEVSQLKSHLESVMEENVLLTDELMDDEGFGDRVQLQLDRCARHASFDVDDNSHYSFNTDLDHTSLSHLVLVSSLSEGAYDDEIKTRFGQLDEALRENQVLLNQVFESGITPQWKPQSLTIITDDVVLCNKSNATDEETIPESISSSPLCLSVPCSPTLGGDHQPTAVDEVFAPVSPPSPGSATLANVNSPQVTESLKFVMLENEHANAITNDPTATLLVAPMSAALSPTWLFIPDTVGSIPSDELLFLKRRRAHTSPTTCEASSSVTEASIQLADHLIDAMHGKEGSDDAVLEQMDKLLTLLLQDDDYDPTDLKRTAEHFHFETLEDLTQLSMEVTLAEFNALSRCDRPMDDTEFLLDEWIDRVTDEVFSSECTGKLIADDASRDECPDPVESSCEGEYFATVRQDMDNYVPEAAESYETEDTEEDINNEINKVLGKVIAPELVHVHDDMNKNIDLLGTQQPNDLTAISNPEVIGDQLVQQT